MFRSSQYFQILLIAFTFFVAPAVPAQNQGPVLKELLQRASQSRMNVTTGEPSKLYLSPVEFVSLDAGAKSVLSFDYVEMDGTEWFLNVSTQSWPEAAMMINQALLPKKPSRAQLYFTKQIETTLTAQKPLALKVQYENGEITLVEALLSRHGPLRTENLAFFPPAPLPYPSISMSGGEHHFWPLVVMRMENFLTDTTFLYHTYLAPLSLGRYTGPLLWVNTSEMEQELEQNKHLVLEVEIRATSVQVYRQIELPEANKTVLEFEAQSNYLSSFAKWFVPLWRALFPRGRSLRVRKNAKSTLGSAVDLEPYLDLRCEPFLTVKTR